MGARGLTYTETSTLVTETCANCGVLFAMPGSLQNCRINDHKSFYCPNGHSLSYSGPTPAQRAEQEAERLRQQLASREDDLRAERMSHAVTKGQLTKTRKRADAGVCQHCQRTFANVGRHVAHMHPDASKV